MNICIIEGCRTTAHSRGFCKKHHQWHWKRGLLPPLPSTEDIFWAHVDKKSPGECWEWRGGRHSAGYGEFKRGGLGRAHRYSFALHYGEIPDGLHVLHKCDNPGCVNPGHLYAGTHQQNMRDMGMSGAQKGERNPRNIITQKTALAILSMFAVGRRQKDIAAECVTSVGVVRSIANRKTWGWLPGAEEAIKRYKSISKHPRGEHVYNSKITDTDARGIFAAQGKHRDIATVYGVSPTLVGNIKRKQAWKHIHQHGPESRHGNSKAFATRNGHDGFLHFCTQKLLGEI
jgi:hypothetical protein